MADRARMLVGVLGDIPLIADADTGYGAAMNVVRTVQLYEQAGVAAIQLEDQVFPKRCGHLEDKQVVGAADFEVTLAAASMPAPTPICWSSRGPTPGLRWARTPRSSGPTGTHRPGPT